MAKTKIPFEEIRKHVPLITVDAIIIKNKKILLIKRATEPYEDSWALPGGFVELGETLEQAVTREIEEETCLKTEPLKLVGAYSDPKRDPRGHTISVAYLTKITGGKPKTTEEAKEVKYFSLTRLPKNLAFDHKKIIDDAEKIIKTVQKHDKDIEN